MNDGILNAYVKLLDLNCRTSKDYVNLITTITYLRDSLKGHNKTKTAQHNRLWFIHTVSP
jgi:hypothetical protein